MEPFCNSCFQWRSDLKCDLLCTQCYHVVCQICFTRNSEHCAVCNAIGPVCKLNRDMPENMKRYFRDPLPEMETLRKIVKFQEEQRSLMAGHSKLVFQEYQRVRMSVVNRKKEYDVLRKKVEQTERLLKGSGYRTPQSSISGTSGSQFTDNVSSIERKTAISDSSFWKDSPRSETSDTFRYGMSRMSIRDDHRRNK